jgi:hypothetical protein
LIFYARKLQIKVYKHCTTVHCAYAYHYVFLTFIRAIPFFRKDADWPIWSEKFVSEVRSYGFKDLLSRKLWIP